MDNITLPTPPFPPLLPRRAFLTYAFLAAALNLASSESRAEAARAEGFTIVREGKPTAVIVLAEQPSEVARYAAQELAYHVQKASGATLPILSEGAPLPDTAVFRIYLGDTHAARAAGIDPAALPPETFTIRTGEKALVISGRDATSSPLEMSTSAGTLFGVYEWLERDLGVRWLWPGDLGTHVPKSPSITVRPIHATVSPPLAQRNVRAGFSLKSETSTMGFTPGAEMEYAKAHIVFVRRHRMGRGVTMNNRHAFTDWWEKYGAEHPEWFQLVHGKRGPVKPKASYTMCVSNPELQKKIVELWKAEGGAKRGPGPSFVDAAENGTPSNCECANCLALDGPNPPDYLKFTSPKAKFYHSAFASDRYARFWLNIQQLAAKENPNAVVVGYVYFNYFQPPTSGIKLNKNILLGFYPPNYYYPRSDEEQAWMKHNWKGWTDTGARLFDRSNHILDGYCMPFIFAHQLADAIQYEYKNGMVATDYDALTGQWAAQGPNLYLLMRIQTHPNAAPDTLLAEYYSGFGAAAPDVKAYFDYWEAYTSENREHIVRTFDTLEASRWRSWAKAAHEVFPESCFAPGEALLAKAAASAAGDKEAAARVAFLQNGLTHAKLCSRAARLLTLADPVSTPERGKAALEELAAFRRAHEREWIGNFNHSAWVEDASWKLPEMKKAG